MATTRQRRSPPRPQHARTAAALAEMRLRDAVANWRRHPDLAAVGPLLTQLVGFCRAREQAARRRVAVEQQHHCGACETCPCCGRERNSSVPDCPECGLPYGDPPAWQEVAYGPRT